ncbi:MAG: right-handed parallel beta-helix repeat-containing protein, partial [Candidatus Methanoplasma sp.]|nr:right-handed parallel beta-helix repeat-containing protein [Candidatus Methanoplasma sp.]
MNLTNAGNPNSGGMSLNGGKYVFENCTFTEITTYNAVDISGGSIYAVFENCTFSNNNRAMHMAPGTSSSDIARYSISNCLFENNSLTSGNISDRRGAALYISGSNYLVEITGSVFADNRVEGDISYTLGEYGNNSRVDGGAIYVGAA